jgi:pyruvate carboxylase
MCILSSFLFFPRTAAIYSHEDRFALHRFKADVVYRGGKPGEPIRPYLDIERWHEHLRAMLD